MKKSLLLSMIIFLFLRLPAQEDLYFNKRIDFYNNYDNSRNIIETDSGYVVSGTTSPPNPNYMYFVHLSFVGLNRQGEINFFKEYGYDTISMFLGNPGSLINYTDTGYVSAGTKRIETESWVHDQGMLAYYNQAFDTLYTVFHGEETLPYDTSFMFYQVKKELDNSLVFVGLRSTYSYPSSLWLLKTDNYGNKLWEKFFNEDIKYYQGHSIVQTNDGGYVIGGYKFKIGVSGSGDPLIIKTDSLGNEEWRINPGNPDIDDNKVMVALGADGNIIAGTNYGTQSSGDNQWMVV